MLLLLLFGVIVSIATVGGIPLDFDQDEYHVEGFLTNDLTVDSSGVDDYSNDLSTYGLPDDSNSDAFSYIRDKSDFNSFSPLPDEPSKEPINEPTNDSTGQSSDPPITNLIGESSISYTLILGNF